MFRRTFRSHILFLLILTAGLATTSFAQIIDPTFTPILQDFGSTQDRASAQVSTLQPDGKILVGGNFTLASGLPRSGVARFNPDGTADVTFDAGNISVAEGLLSVTTGGTIYAIKVQPDGKILIGGVYRRDSETFGRCLERLNADGSVDTSFNSAILNDFASVGDIEIQSDGKIVVGGTFDITAVNPANGQSTRFRNLARLNTDGSFDFSFVANAPEYIRAVVIQPDGKIVTGNASVTAAPNRLIRFNTNGSLDRVLTELDGWVTAMELLPDGKFVISGDFTEVNGTFQKLVARINPDGTRDASFNTNIGFIDTFQFQDVVVQPDGKVIVCGDFHVIGSFTRWRVARFNTDGSMDTTFNTATPIAGVVGEILLLPDGKIFIGGAFPLEDNNLFYNNIGRMNADGSIDANFNHANIIHEGEGNTILQQPDGKILVGGFMYYANNVKRRGIARYNADGTLDTGFVPFESLAWVLDMALQPDGKIIVVNSDSPSSLFRLNPDGSRDTGFNAPFVSFSASIQKRTRITSVVLLPDGKVLVGGQLITGSATSPTLSGLARLNADGTRDQSFQLVGALGGTRDVHDIALQPDGKIVIGGDFTHINNNNQFHYLARVNADGTPDPTFTSPFTPIPSPVIYEIELQPDGKVIYAGNFNVISRVNSDGSPDAAFNVPVNNQVDALKLKPDGKILVGGHFTAIAGAQRERIAQLHPDGSIDAAFNLPKGANNIVYDLELQQDGKILVAGAFTKLGNVARIGAARLIDAKATFDFDGDGETDMSVFRPSQGTWYLQQSTMGFAAAQLGTTADNIAPADYDGDGKTDLAIFRDGTWNLLCSQNGTSNFQFGVAGDQPVPGDYDGDGKTDVAVFRPSAGVWYIWRSSDGQFDIRQFGLNGDKALTGDYDGDGMSDVTIWRPSNGAWYIWLSGGGYFITQFGLDGDIPTVGDFDGDKKADITIYRPSNGAWYVIESSNGNYRIMNWGLASDKPVPGDYDRDGKTDFAVFRESEGNWYIYKSSIDNYVVVHFGMSGDIPIPAAFIR